MATNPTTGSVIGLPSCLKTHATSLVVVTIGSLPIRSRYMDVLFDRWLKHEYASLEAPNLGTTCPSDKCLVCGSHVGMCLA